MCDFWCMGCGEDVSADPKDYHIEQDGDKVYVTYTLRCPKCGRIHKCREVFTWDGIVDMH